MLCSCEHRTRPAQFDKGVCQNILYQVRSRLYLGWFPEYSSASDLAWAKYPQISLMKESGCVRSVKEIECIGWGDVSCMMVCWRGLGRWLMCSEQTEIELEEMRKVLRDWVRSAVLDVSSFLLFLLLLSSSRLFDTFALWIVLADVLQDHEMIREASPSQSF